MASEILTLMNPLDYFVMSIKIKKKETEKSLGSILEVMQPNHAVSSFVTATKLPLCFVKLKKL